MADVHPDDLKDRGNVALREGRFEDAIALYTQAIALEPKAVYFNNRAIAHQNLRRFDAAVADATLALEHDSRYVKAWTTKS